MKRKINVVYNKTIIDYCSLWVIITRLSQKKKNIISRLAKFLCIILQKHNTVAAEKYNELKFELKTS